MPIPLPALIGEILSYEILSCDNNYIEDMATFTTLVKIYSNEYFSNTKGSWDWRNFSAIYGRKEIPLCKLDSGPSSSILQ